MAAERGSAVAAHDDETLEHVEEAARLGITIPEFPTTLLAAEAARDRGMVTVMGAPYVVKAGSHAGNLPAIELARVGLVGVLTSDSRPVSMLAAALRPAELARGSSRPAAVTENSPHPAAEAKTRKR